MSEDPVIFDVNSVLEVDQSMIDMNDRNATDVFQNSSYDELSGEMSPLNNDSSTGGGLLENERLNYDHFGKNCDKCGIKEVQVKCDQCEHNFCNGCDKVVHKIIKDLKKHDRKRISSTSLPNFIIDNKPRTCQNAAKNQKPVYNLFDKFAVELNRPKFAAAEAALKNSKLANITSIEDLPVSRLVSKRQQRKLKKIERQKTAGPNWFNMKAPEIDDELKTNLELLRLRSVMDPKRFYRKTSAKTKPKYFHVCK